MSFLTGGLDAKDPNLYHVLEEKDQRIYFTIKFYGSMSKKKKRQIGEAAMDKMVEIYDRETKK